MARAPFFRYAAGWITLLVWALAAGSALYWVLHARGDTPALLPAPPLAEAPAVSVQAVAHALGAPNASAQVAAVTQEGLGSRVRLLGVVTQGAEDGAALLVVDGKPPRPYRVGAPVVGHWRLASVTPRKAQLRQDEQRIDLAMPPLAQPARESAASARLDAAPAAPVAQQGDGASAPKPGVLAPAGVSAAP